MQPTQNAKEGFGAELFKVSIRLAHVFLSENFPFYFCNWIVVSFKDLFNSRLFNSVLGYTVYTSMYLEGSREKTKTGKEKNNLIVIIN